MTDKQTGMALAGVLVGVPKGEITTTPLAELVAAKKPLDENLVRLADVLAR